MNKGPNKAIVLVVDDHEINEDHFLDRAELYLEDYQGGQVVRLVEEFGYCVPRLMKSDIGKASPAYRVDTLVSMIKSQQPCVVVMDLNIAEKIDDGLDVVEQCSDLPIVWVLNSNTAFQDRAVQQRALDLGVRVAFKKNEDALFKHLDTLLEFGVGKRFIYDLGVKHSWECLSRAAVLINGTSVPFGVEAYRAFQDEWDEIELSRVEKAFHSMSFDNLMGFSWNRVRHLACTLATAHLREEYEGLPADKVHNLDLLDEIRYRGRVYGDEPAMLLSQDFSCDPPSDEEFSQMVDGLRSVFNSVYAEFNYDDKLSPLSYWLHMAPNITEGAVSSDLLGVYGEALGIEPSMWREVFQDALDTACQCHPRVFEDIFPSALKQAALINPLLQRAGLDEIAEDEAEKMVTDMITYYDRL